MALPITTQRAAFPAAHPVHLVESDAAAPERRQASRPTRPFSCSTNLANEVTDQLRRAKLGSRALEFCLYLHRQTFGNAGWHRKLGREEWWCAFDLATWSVALACNKSNVRRIRADLEACQIIRFEPDPSHPGQRRMGWNLAFAEWQPYDGRRVGRAKKSEVTAEKRAAVVISHQQRDVVICEQPRSDSVQEAALRPGASGPMQQEGVVISYSGFSASLASKQLRQLDKKQSKITTLASSEVAQQPAPALPVRKGLRKKAPETLDRVSEGQRPSPASLPDDNNHDVIPSGTASLTAPAVSSDQKEEETSLEGVSSHQPAKQEASWPPRQAWEKSDLDYYQRVLREREKERVPLLVRLAHERTGVPLETASYARIGALAKQCGAALVVKHILLAAANHIDGDPLAYLTKLVHSPQAGHARKKEAFHDTTRTHSSDNGDTPKRSGWDGWDVATAR